MRLDKGKLEKHQRKPKEERIPTADIYFDKKGRKRYKGNRNLSATENLDFTIKQLQGIDDGFFIFIRVVLGWLVALLVTET